MKMQGESLECVVVAGGHHEGWECLLCVVLYKGGLAYGAQRC